MAKSKCCNSEILEVGFREAFTKQRFKCSKCHKPVKKKFFNIFTFLVLSLSLILLINSVSALTSTATVDFDDEVGQIREDAYGVYTGYFISNQTYVDTDGTGTLETRSNSTWHKEQLLNFPFKVFRRDTNTYYYYQNWSATTGWNYTSTASEMKSIHFYDIKWAYENNVKFLYVGSTTNVFLQNKTSGYCNLTTSASNQSCPPTDYKLFANMTSDFFMNVTNQGQYQNAIMFECKNEVNSVSWLSNLSRGSSTRANVTIELCNEIYTALKRDLPNITLVSPSVAFSMDGEEIFYDIIQNLSNKVDAYTYHSYSGASLGTVAKQDLDYIIANMTARNIPRKQLILGEFNMQSDVPLMNASTRNWTLQSSIYSNVFSSLLNTYPNITFLPYKWTEKYLYNQSNYPEYPDYYSMINEPAMNITKYNQSYYYPFYNITRTFATNHKALNTVVTSSSSDSTVKVVASKDAQNIKYITITNTNTSSFNITINGLTSGMKNVETNEIYPINSGSVTINNIPSYGVYTLTSTSYPQISFVSPTPSNGSTVPTRNFIINATIDTENPLSSIIYTWNNTNYSIYDDSLVLYYNFDNRSSLGENDTHVKDISKWGNNGTIVNKSSSYATGYYNLGYKFNGNATAGSYINLTNPSKLNFSLGDNFTISGWIKSNFTYTDEGNILSKRGSSGGYYQVAITTSGTLKFLLTNTSLSKSVDSSVNINDNNWHYFTAIYNSTAILLYVDNSLKATTQMGVYTGNINSDYPLLLGCQGNSNVRCYNGTLDNLKVYSKVLSISDMQKEYNSFLITKLNNSQFNVYINQTNITGINYNSYNLFVNDTTNNINQSNRLIRILSNIYLSTSSIGTVSQTFFGANTHGTFGSNYTWIDTNSDGIYDTFSNYTYHQNLLLQSKMNIYRADMKLNRVSINETTFNYTALNTTQTNMLTPISAVAFAKANNKKITFIADTIPLWLANQTTGYCNSTALYSCPPTNYTKFGNLVVNFLNNVSCDANTCEVEVMNEPYQATWLNNLSYDHINKSYEYLKLYNATYWAVKTAFPTMVVGGNAGFRDAPNMTRTFISNWSSYGYNFDFVSIHPYGYTRTNALEQLSDTINLKALCLTYNSNCSRIILSEWNVGTAELQNLSYGVNEYSSSLSQSYISLLNYAPNNITNMLYQWSDYTPYSHNGYIWYMVSEPLLDNTIMPSFNVTYRYTRYAPALGTVYATTNDNSELVQVQVREQGSKQNLIVTNTYNDEQNVSLNCGSFTGNLIDVSSGSLYSCASGSVNLGVLDAYDVRYFTEPVITHPTFYNYLGEDLGYFNPYYVGSIEQLEDTNSQMCTYFSNGIGGFAGYIPTTLLILGVVIVISVVVILLYSLRNIEKNGLNSLSMNEIPTEYIGAVVIGLGAIVFIAFAGLFSASIICSIGF